MERIKPGSLRAWLMLPRFHFIPLTIILVSLGTAVAAYEGLIQWGYFFLALIGSVLVHMTVNVINDYHDYVDGIDLRTRRTPFSGGSGVLPLKLLEPKQAFWFATLCLMISMVIGFYFVWMKGWLLIPLLLVSGFSVLFLQCLVSPG